MEVEYIQQQGHVFYRLYNAYAEDSLAMDPRELMELLIWLQEHEDEITGDTISNHVLDEMKGL